MSLHGGGGAGVCARPQSPLTAQEAYYELGDRSLGNASDHDAGEICGLTMNLYLVPEQEGVQFLLGEVVREAMVQETMVQEMVVQETMLRELMMRRIMMYGVMVQEVVAQEVMALGEMVLR